MPIIQLCFLPEFSNTCSIIEHDLKSKELISLKFCKHVCNRLILNLKKIQLHSISILKVIKKNREGGGGKFTPIRSKNLVELGKTIYYFVSLTHSGRVGAYSGPGVVTDAQVAVFGRQNESPVSWLSNEPKIEP